MPRELKPCGTPAAYRRHKRRGEKIDQACKIANSKDVKKRRRALYQRARDEAIRALINKHRSEYRSLIAQARQEIEHDGHLAAPTVIHRVSSEMTKHIAAWIEAQRHPVRLLEIRQAFAGRYRSTSVCQAVQRMHDDGRLTRVEKGVYWIKPWYGPLTW